MNKKIFIASFIFLISCAEKSDKQNLETNMPKSWVKENENTAKKEKIILNWWDNFNDPVLDNLIKDALKNNTDIKIALANIEQAEAALARDRSSLLPSIDLSASGERLGNSKELTNIPNTKPANTFSTNAGLSYQVDLWNKISSANKASKALLLAAQSTRDNVNLTVASDLSKAYFNMLSLIKQKNLLTESITIQKEIYKLNEVQHTVGSIDYETLISIKSNLNSLEDSLSSINQSYTEQVNAIKILVGTKPENFLDNIIIKNDLDNIVAAPIIPKIMPLQLLTQRPDIKAAEENLKAANIQVAIARKYYLPDISIIGLVGLTSSKIEDFVKSAGTWQIGANLAAPLFDFGKNRANLKIQEAKTKTSLANYQQIIITSLGEVLNALSFQNNSEISFYKNHEKEAISRKIDKMTRLKYSTGYSSYLAVLASRQNLINAEIQTAKAKQQQLNAMIEIFKSLGGSW